MKAGFSEFSYGYALTEEFMRSVRASNPTFEAPYFPTLWQEGQAGFGYDVRITAIASFFQFKPEGGNCRDESALQGTDYHLLPDPGLLTVVEALCASVVQKAYDRGYRDAMLERKALEAEGEITEGLRESDRERQKRTMAAWFPEQGGE